MSFTFHYRLHLGLHIIVEENRTANKEVTSLFGLAVIYSAKEIKKEKHLRLV